MAEPTLGSRSHLPLNQQTIANSDSGPNDEEQQQDGQAEQHNQQQEEETETHYVTLDLSSFSNASTIAGQPPQPPDLSSLQILDLSSPHPLILYRGRTYTCTWGSTIGTDMILGVKAPELDYTYEPPQPVGSEEVEAEVIGLASVRLTARPVEVALKQDIAAAASEEQASTSASKAGPLSQAFGEGSARAKQASFLERLQAIKSAKGEVDRVPLNPPSWKPPPTSTQVRGQERRVRRGRGGRKRGVGRSRGGLFRDYIPRLGDEANADIRAAVESVARGEVVASREEVPIDEDESEDEDEADGGNGEDTSDDDDDDEDEDGMEEVDADEGDGDVEMQDP